MENFKEILDRIKFVSKCTNYDELADFLKISRSAIDGWVRRKIIPEKNILKICQQTGKSLEWILGEEKNEEIYFSNELEKKIKILRSYKKDWEILDFLDSEIFEIIILEKTEFKKTKSLIFSLIGSGWNRINNLRILVRSIKKAFDSSEKTAKNIILEGIRNYELVSSEKLFEIMSEENKKNVFDWVEQDFSEDECSIIISDIERFEDVIKNLENPKVKL